MGEKKTLQERLDKGFVLCAEGYLFELERRGYVQAGSFVPEVVLEYPEAVRELHREFLLCGSDIMEALTYYAHRDKLKVIGRENDLEKLNRQALRIAREAAEEGGGLLAGNVSNTWSFNPKEPEESTRHVKAMFREQVAWAKDAGADFIIAETFDYVGEAKAALEVIKEAKMPAVVTFAAHAPKTADSIPVEEACLELEEAGASVVGLNCTRGPATMLPLLKKIREKVKGHVAALPVPYRTTQEKPTFQQLVGEKGFPAELDMHLLTRREVAEFAVKAKKMGVNYLGACCGSFPHHLRAMAEALGRAVPASRYSPDMSKHGLFGKEDVVKYNKELRKSWGI